jgi:circadian clock protein KaiC
VAQLASALAWGARGRKFESSHPDLLKRDQERKLVALFLCPISKFITLVTDPLNLMENLSVNPTISKAPTGIRGLDEITYGGLPKGRPTLITGYTGSGKTVLAMQFILNGIQMYDEPGVYISLEEGEEDLRNNMASFGYDLRRMEEEGLLHLETIRVKHSALFHSGQFDLSPLFIRIEEAVNRVGAKRLVIDTFELIFNDIQDENIFRQELVRLILWLKERDLTIIFTCEWHKDTPAQKSIEEFITDCVISLQHHVLESIYTRRLHIIKYRGSKHGTNEYPFLIEENGISILPITTTEVANISEKVISTGIGGLDGIISGGGFYVGSSTLVSGESGTGKTSFAVSFCVESMKQNRKCIFFTFEESVLQLKRNMGSLGFDLEEYEKKGLLRIFSTRPTLLGLESHLLLIYRSIEDFSPDVVVFDPITDLMQVGSMFEVRSMLLRIIDSLKNQLITIVFTALTSSAQFKQYLAISSLVDNWISLNMVRTGRNLLQSLRITKIRGTDHSRKEYLLDFSSEGLRIKEFMEDKTNSWSE